MIQFAIPFRSGLVAALGACLVLTACSSRPHIGSDSSEHISYSVEFGSGPTPWNHADFDAARDKFTFAVFSDLTGGEREDIFRVAMAQIRLLRPEFIMSVGDLIEGGTENREQLRREWDSFDDRAGRAIGPVFYVGGNHDLTNAVQWEVWEDRYGPRYYHFRYKDVLFLVLDTEDNSPERQQEIHEAREVAYQRAMEEGWGIWSETEYAQMQETHTGTIGARQSEFFVGKIREHSDVRWTFVFMHKPAWLRENEQNFLAIEEALTGRNYTVFNGHNHDYKYRTRRGQDYIQLATTGGVQLAGKENAVDHITLVTVSESGVDIANLELSGIFDKTGNLPLNGETLCFEEAECGSQ